MTKYLETETGSLIGAPYIVRIGGLNERPTRRWHEIDYVHGSEGHTTTASAEAVAEFLYLDDG